jgi:hypothetical protein
MKRTFRWFAGWSTATALALVCTTAVRAQVRPYIGYTYPAGGQQGTTFQIKLGGQGLDDVHTALVTGSGVTTRVVDYYRRLNNQDIQLLREQLRELQQTRTVAAAAPPMTMTMDSATMMSETTGEKTPAGPTKDERRRGLIAKVDQRVRDWVQTPACVSISSLVIVEVTIAPDAEPGARELRLVSARGVSNPLAFHVGQVPEYARKAMNTAVLQILGKESQALRKRPVDEAEVRIAVPCTVNGQIASGEVNRYRFVARQGQRLVVSTLGRQLIPFIADAVPGWFQPVLTLYDAQGRELAFADDYRFKPDPVLLFEVPRDGEYVFAIQDSLYRGREDFIYRITVGEVPFVTSHFPLGGRAGAAAPPRLAGWNLGDAAADAPPKNAAPGIRFLAAKTNGLVSNPLPFALDTLPEVFDQGANNTEATAQKVTLPVIVNGRIEMPDDRDVFQFTGRADQTVVAEVQARRLDSPLDSVIKLTDAAGRVLAFSDDREDLAAGANTHQADSYFSAKLPADGTYYVHLADTARRGGEEYGYRLRLSAPQPDFELRIVPSSVSLRTGGFAGVTVYIKRLDGFAGPVRLTLQNPPAGFAAQPVVLAPNQNEVRFNFKGPAQPTPTPVNLTIAGSAKIGPKDVVHPAVPAEDRMQAFLWRQLVPASELSVLVFDPNYHATPRHPTPPRPAPPVDGNKIVAAVAAAATPPAGAAMPAAAPTTSGAPPPAGGTSPAAAAAPAADAPKPKFTKQQIAGRLRQLKLLYEEGLLTDAFYDTKVTECEAAQ